MKQVNENIWGKALLRAVLVFGLFGLCMTALALFLPQSFNQPPWDQNLFLGITKKLMVFGAVPGILWFFLFYQQTNLTMLFIFGCFGMFLFSIGSDSPSLPPVISLVIGLIIAVFAARGLLKQIATVQSYANKADIDGEERYQIINTLFQSIVNSKSEKLRILSSETIKLFGAEGIDILVNNLDQPHPLAKERIAYALGIIGDKKALIPLRELAQTEQDPTVKEKVIEAISQIGRKVDPIDWTVQSMGSTSEGYGGRIGIAAQEGNTRAVEALLNSGILPDIEKSEDEMTELHVTCRGGFLETAKVLIRHGADVNIQDKYGFTPLIYAVTSRNMDLVRELIINGADVNMKAAAGATALIVAAQAGDIGIVQMLLQKGANTEPSITESLHVIQPLKKGMNAIDVATMYDHFEVVNLIKKFQKVDIQKLADETENEGNIARIKSENLEASVTDDDEWSDEKEAELKRALKKSADYFNNLSRK